MDLELFLQTFTAWAASRPDIAAVALVGSHARGTAGPDSDVDLVILTAEPETYLADTRWAGQWGEIASITLEEYGAVTSLRVVYHGGPEVEYGLARPAWADQPLEPGTAQVVAGGLRVLHDPQGLLGRQRND